MPRGPKPLPLALNDDERGKLAQCAARLGQREQPAGRMGAAVRAGGSRGGSHALEVLFRAGALPAGFGRERPGADLVPRLTFVWLALAPLLRGSGAAVPWRAIPRAASRISVKLSSMHWA